MRLYSIRFGTNDIVKARAFYDATFAALGASVPDHVAGEKFVRYRLSGFNFSVGPTRDGQPATHANGGTILFAADDDATVAAWHAAGLANGGTSDGDPGPRPQAGDAFGAYLRDPDGNKLGVFHGL